MHSWGQAETIMRSCPIKLCWYMATSCAQHYWRGTLHGHDLCSTFSLCDLEKYSASDYFFSWSEKLNILQFMQWLRVWSFNSSESVTSRSQEPNNFSIDQKLIVICFSLQMSPNIKLKYNVLCFCMSVPSVVLMEYFHSQVQVDIQKLWIPWTTHLSLSLILHCFSS
jgi:hypothetical protein